MRTLDYIVLVGLVAIVIALAVLVGWKFRDDAKIAAKEKIVEAQRDSAYQAFWTGDSTAKAMLLLWDTQEKARDDSTNESHDRRIRSLTIRVDDLERKVAWNGRATAFQMDIPKGETANENTLWFVIKLLIGAIATLGGFIAVLLKYQASTQKNREENDRKDKMEILRVFSLSTGVVEGMRAFIEAFSIRRK